MITKSFLLIVLLLGYSQRVAATEFHVSTGGSDTNDGSREKPYLTISAAAEAAMPGDTITVHAGVYRERVNPPRGGKSDTQRIVYQAAPAELVEIAGSEVAKSWVKIQDDVWKLTLPNALFGAFNPYSDLVHGDWFQPKGREHHTGAVYINGNWLAEAAKLADVLNPSSAPPAWFAQVDQDNTTIWAPFKGVNPNEQLVEINVRQTVFYPARTGINYLTLRGFTLRDAATPWAPPTAEQIGLVGTNWSKGWVIENNVVRHSMCVGIALGKFGDAWDNTACLPGANSAQGYVAAVGRAAQHDWNKESIGHHIIRHNSISYCDQAGIDGSLGAVFSQIVGNDIFQIANQGHLDGAEMAGIKFHAAIDVLIAHNRIHDTCLGMWMDWMAQGTRISRNLCYNNRTDLFMEVDHGPYLVDDNLFLSCNAFKDLSEDGAFVHNLFVGSIDTNPDARATEYFEPHSTTIAGLIGIEGGGDRFFNNIFIGDGNPADGLRRDPFPNRFKGFGLGVYNASKHPAQTGGNVFLRDAYPYDAEKDAVVQADLDPEVQVIEDGDHVRLQMTLGPNLARAGTALVTTALLGRARVPNAAYENPDGTPLQLETDYFGRKRDVDQPAPGPFAHPAAGREVIEVW